MIANLTIITMNKKQTKTAHLIQYRTPACMKQKIDENRSVNKFMQSSKHFSLTCFSFD